MWGGGASGARLGLVCAQAAPPRWAKNPVVEPVYGGLGDVCIAHGSFMVRHVPIIQFMKYVCIHCVVLDSLLVFEQRLVCLSPPSSIFSRTVVVDFEGGVNTHLSG